MLLPKRRNTGLDKARAAAAASGGKVVVPRVKGNGHLGMDFNDLHQAEGKRAVAKQVAAARHVSSADLLSAVSELAKLSPIEQEQAITQYAKRLGVPRSAVRRQIRQHIAAEQPAQSIILPNIEPWDEAVHREELLDELTAAIRRHVVVSKHASLAIALWCIYSHAIDLFGINPRLVFMSAEMRSGKTRALETVQCLVQRALMTSNISTAALFRIVDQLKPSLLIDEADAFIKLREELRGVLNSGHARASAFIFRCAGDDNHIARFSTWSPIAVALIGHLPVTLRDRSIEIEMVRKRLDVAVKPLTDNRRQELGDIGRRIARFVKDYADDIRNAHVKRIAGLNDRAWDNWRPLAKIASVIGGDAPDRVRVAAVKLSGADRDKDSIRVLLLRDLKELFDDVECDWLPTNDILAHLHAREERPWPAWRNDAPMTANQLAFNLKPFKIAPDQKKENVNGKQKVTRGYDREQFEDSWARYVEK